MTVGVATDINPVVTTPGMPEPTTVQNGYDYNSAIQRRSEDIDLIGKGQNDYSKQLADRRVETQGAKLISDATNNAAKVQAAATAAATAAANKTINNKVLAADKAGTGISPDGSLRSKLVSGAAAFKGVNYKWGGNTPKGFDCSGLVQYVYGKYGINDGRTSQQQATHGTVTPLNKLQQGDFVAWGNSPATSHHIAIYAGNGMVWESPKTGSQVRLRRIYANEAGIMGIHLNI